MPRYAISLIAVVLVSASQGADPQAAKVSIQRNGNGVQVLIDDQQVAEYVFNDDQILRPYFKHLRTLGGQQVTRNCPPTGVDLDDHPTMHPGMWLAFGDLKGQDFWRNKAKVKHAGFIKQPQDGMTTGSFSVRNSYEADGKTICTEDCSITFSVANGGYLIDWVSLFRSDNGGFSFGDQEEMGLGVRVATPLAVVKGGEMEDSQGRKNGKQVWGKQAEWCRYSGLIDGRHAGIVLMPHPGNFRPSWFHARDYGLLVANPFGRNAFTNGLKSKVEVSKGNDFRLRFGVLVYESMPETPVKFDSVYQEFAQSK